MVNSLAFKVAILKAGLSRRKLAELLGLTDMTLYRKMYNMTEFRSSEIKEIQQLLHLSNAERDEIFFN